MKKINFGISLELFGFICLFVAQYLGTVFMITGFIFSLIGLLFSFAGYFEN